MAEISREHVLEILTGAGRPPSMRVRPGEMFGPMSVGTAGAWPVDAPGVMPHHAELYFNGSQLYIRSTSPEAPVMVGRREVGNAWSAIDPPCDLRFGAARVRFGELGGEVWQMARVEMVEDDETVVTDAATRATYDPRDDPAAAAGGAAPKSKAAIQDEPTIPEPSTRNARQLQRGQNAPAPPLASGVPPARPEAEASLQAQTAPGEGPRRPMFSGSDLTRLDASEVTRIEPIDVDRLSKQRRPSIPAGWEAGGRRVAVAGAEAPPPAARHAEQAHPYTTSAMGPDDAARTAAGSSIPLPHGSAPPVRPDPPAFGAPPPIPPSYPSFGAPGTPASPLGFGEPPSSVEPPGFDQLSSMNAGLGTMRSAPLPPSFGYPPAPSRPPISAAPDGAPPTHIPTLSLSPSTSNWPAQAPALGAPVPPSRSAQAPAPVRPPLATPHDAAPVPPGPDQAVNDRKGPWARLSRPAKLAAVLLLPMLAYVIYVYVGIPRSGPPARVREAPEDASAGARVAPSQTAHPPTGRRPLPGSNPASAPAELGAAGSTPPQRSAGGAVPEPQPGTTAGAPESNAARAGEDKPPEDDARGNDVARSNEDRTSTKDGGAATEQQAASRTTGGKPTDASAKSLQREAVDAVAAGSYARAAEIYEELSRTYPNQPAYAEAAAIMRAKANTIP